MKTAVEGGIEQIRQALAVLPILRVDRAYAVTPGKCDQRQGLLAQMQLAKN